MLITTVRMPLHQNLTARFVRVFLMGHAQLVVADDFRVRDLFPCGGAAEVLGHQAGVAQYVFVGDHGDEVVGGHGFPEFVEEGAVVDADGWGDDFTEAGPVLEWEESS